jgi:hypothetical protein
MHFHLPKPLHGWREFAGEVGIIVVGVLIARGRRAGRRDALVAHPSADCAFALADRIPLDLPLTLRKPNNEARSTLETLPPPSSERASTAGC